MATVGTFFAPHTVLNRVFFFSQAYAVYKWHDLLHHHTDTSRRVDWGWANSSFCPRVACTKPIGTTAMLVFVWLLNTNQPRKMVARVQSVAEAKIRPSRANFPQRSTVLCYTMYGSTVTICRSPTFDSSFLFLVVFSLLFGGERARYPREWVNRQI